DDGSFAEPSFVVAPEATGLDDDAYLALPPGIDPGIASLAQEVTDLMTSDFEKGLALEAFFRAPGGFTYSAAIDPGHGAEDLAAWLLEPDSPNYRTGYCEQFATSMAVMARQLGIPSRVALGFTPGAMLDDGRVVVRDRNAHAWVELWMPTQGWVRFDPTPRGDGVNPSAADDLPFPISRYLDTPPVEAPPATVPQTIPTTPSSIPVGVELGGANDTSPGSDGNGFSSPPWAPWAALGAALVFGLVPAIKAARSRIRMRRLASGDITSAWREVVDRLDDLGVHPEATATPMEVATDFSPVMVPLAEVYGQRLYGDPARMPGSAVEVATRSLAETRRALAFKFSRPRRMLARYRVSSLAPGWMNRRSGRS
ncbi:MAG: transglutaminase-like domain-containing protein, partial [Acidimicrobiia bacterium]|nr:transglutaminase-like domain-containing protein [Acidimicrobiia bacterium]